MIHMPDFGGVISDWGYLAIFLLVICGNVGIGYAMGYGVGPYIARFQHAIGVGEDVILSIVIMLLVILLGWRVRRAHRPARKA